MGPASAVSTGGEAKNFVSYLNKVYWVSYEYGDFVGYDPSKTWTGVSENGNPKQLNEIKATLSSHNSLRASSLFAFNNNLWSGLRMTKSKTGSAVFDASVIARQSLTDDNDFEYWVLDEFGSDGIAGLCMIGNEMWGASFSEIFRWDYATEQVAERIPIVAIDPSFNGKKFKRVVCSNGNLYGSIGSYIAQGDDDGYRVTDTETTNYYLVYDPITKTKNKVGQVSPRFAMVELNSLTVSPDGIVYGLLTDESARKHTIGYINPNNFEWTALGTFSGSNMNRMNGWTFIEDDVYIIGHDGGYKLVKYSP